MAMEYANLDGQNLIPPPAETGSPDTPSEVNDAKNQHDEPMGACRANTSTCSLDGKPRADTPMENDNPTIGEPELSELVEAASATVVALAKQGWSRDVPSLPEKAGKYEDTSLRETMEMAQPMKAKLLQQETRAKIEEDGMQELWPRIRQGHRGPQSMFEESTSVSERVGQDKQHSFVPNTIKAEFDDSTTPANVLVSPTTTTTSLPEVELAAAAAQFGDDILHPPVDDDTAALAEAAAAAAIEGATSGAPFALAPVLTSGEQPLPSAVPCHLAVPVSFDNCTDPQSVTLLTTAINMGRPTDLPVPREDEVDLSSFPYEVMLGRDVVSGKGGKVQQVNRHFRNLVAAQYPLYDSTSSKISKRKIGLKIYQEVIDRGGRFLDHDGVPMDQPKAVLKVMKALKDAKTWTSDAKRLAKRRREEGGGKPRLSGSKKSSETPAAPKRTKNTPAKAYLDGENGGKEEEEGDGSGLALLYQAIGDGDKAVEVTDL